MPYSAEHKSRTRSRIVDAARRLFKLHGYNGVGIDRIMGEAGLTRGGFYAHFNGKDELFAEVVEELGPSPEMQNRILMEKETSKNNDNVTAFIRAYLSREHRNSMADGCPLATLSTEVGRAGPLARQRYTRALRSAADRLARSFARRSTGTQAKAYAMLATCVGGMVLARAVEDENVADAILTACEKAAIQQMRAP